MPATSDFVPTRPSPLAHVDSRPATLPSMLEAMDALRSKPIVSLGQALEQLNLLDPAQLDALLQEDPDLLRSRSSELVKRVLLTPEDLHHAPARTAGIVEIDATRFDVHDEASDALPMRILRAHDLLVLGSANDMLFIASWCPTSEDLHSQLCALTGRRVMLVWADREAIASRLDRLDPNVPKIAPEAATHQTSQVSLSEHPTPLYVGLSEQLLEEQDIATIMACAAHELATGIETEEETESNMSSSMVRLVKRMIVDAQTMHASDIHIETNPGEEFTRIRMRRDGDLELYQKLLPALRAPLVSRIKVMAKLDIAEHRRPQDGKINFAEFGGKNLELRVAIMPTHDGMEDVVLRLLSSAKPIPLARLGFQDRDIEVVARISSRSFGLILAAGPTGSGKTTTLHSVLEEINTDDKKIWTAEDPIEITHPGLRQVQVNPKIGLTFANAMRGFLRSDPDIIMIGEIRDEDTAKIAIEASLTGHLVLSTLHTNSAAESVVRLIDMGMDAMNFADSLVGIVAQRLVRSLCPQCAEERALSPEQWTELVKEYIHASPLSTEEGAARLLEAAGVDSPQALRIMSPRGCSHCGGKGYKGRIGIYEILENNANLRLLIQRSARPIEIYTEAIRGGMRSLRHDALEKWVLGRIDLRQARIAYL